MHFYNSKNNDTANILALVGFVLDHIPRYSFPFSDTSFYPIADSWLTGGLVRTGP